LIRSDSDILGKPASLDHGRQASSGSHLRVGDFRDAGFLHEILQLRPWRLWDFPGGEFCIDLGGYDRESQSANDLSSPLA
jgi:hypothetical protein